MPFFYKYYINKILMASIGIDLGTTNSCVGVWENDCVTIVNNKDGYHPTKSVVYFTNEVLEKMKISNHPI